MAKGSDPWETRGSRKIQDFALFQAVEVDRVGPDGRSGRFLVLNAPDWGVAIPVLERDGVRRLLAVRQFRHGSGRVSVEFPGGVAKQGEDPQDAANRELEEETGYRAGRMTLLGDVSPNPALFSNRFRVYLAEDLRRVGDQSLDEHEIVDVEELPEGEFLEHLGRPPYDHALMSAAAFLYVRYRGGLTVNVLKGL